MPFRTPIVGQGSGSPSPVDCCCCDDDVTFGDETPVFAGAALCYIFDDTVGLTDARFIARSRFVGFWAGDKDPCCEDGSVRETGICRFAAFTTDGGQPNAGDPVYLALATDDSGGGAGKLTATAPIGAGEIVAEVGICKSSADYGALKICKVLIQVKEPTVNPTP